MFIIDYIGYIGPFILLIINVILLPIFNINFHFLYLILFGNFFNLFFNYVLKDIFKIKRQKQKPFMGHIEKSYAMPSGHSQLITFNSTLLTLIYRNLYITLFSIILCINTFYQRYNYRNHTIPQIIIGGIIGILVGLLFYNIHLNIFIKNKSDNKNEKKINNKNESNI